MNASDALGALRQDDWWAPEARESLTWIGDAAGPEIVDDLVAMVPKLNPEQGAALAEVLARFAPRIGRASLPILLAGLQHGRGALRLASFELAREVASRRDASVIGDALRQLAAGPARGAVLAVRMMAEFDPEGLADALWSALDADVRSVRNAAARALAVHDPAGLLDRLVSAPEDQIRDEIVAALTAAGHELDTPAAVPAEWTDRGGAIYRWPARWLELRALAPPRLTDGRPLTESAVRWMCAHQADVFECALHPEVARLCTVIEPDSGGDLALALLEAFLAAQAPPRHHWVMAIGAVLGDGRWVARVAVRIREWADDNKIAHCRFAVEALALNGCDVALVVLDDLARRFDGHVRSRYRTVGEAARHALEAEARRRRLTRNQLADLAVPRFGFPEGSDTWTLETSQRRIELFIDRALCLRMRDADSGKSLRSLPNDAPDEARIALKGARRQLRQVVAAQNARLERALSEGRRWTAARWHRIYAGHPLLARYLELLLWGVYEDGVRLVATFHTRADGVFCDVAGVPVAVADDARVGIVHPLDLDDEARTAWLGRLTGDGSVQPFAQIDRRITALPATGRAVYAGLAGHALPALALRGGVQRVGWHDGEPAPSGVVHFVWRRCAAVRLEAYVEVDGYGLSAQPGDEARLGRVYFGRLRGDARDPPPIDADDPRALDVADVPACAFSEAVYWVHALV